ncbi:peptidase M61 [Formosa algae]|uniref:Metalloprotease with PDZ domain n=1 Tax=Formosa algae TaxID=225843 RepID=A0A9X0YPR7_9FLAO|nr:peptidase M61 [Formosa algae]MBP1841122.1 putative metalloprotease with PDZ domain [Formosa algae]MDQ0336458.1 putative metalloprotease with PDZ domain [Formosa algae]OEI81419.1 peptidase M61 [Formosa algae]
MKNQFLALALASVVLVGCGSTKTVSKNDAALSTPIATSINLTKVVNDKAPVTINPGRFSQDTVIYRLPRVVQGTYSVSDFGKYIDDFKAFNYEGVEIPTKKTDVNSWTIANAENLDYITYYVNDTFDIEEQGGIGEEQPFSPSGTNIEPDNYVLNLHGFIGYFDSLKNNQYTLDVTAPESFKRTSALQNVKETLSEDGKVITTSYAAPRYFDITDNPMMYGNLDVEEFQVGDIKIVLSVYSPTKAHNAKKLRATMEKMMQAQKAFLGDINSTPRYDIYLYLAGEGDDQPKGFGALEHNTSTVVVLQEAESEEALDESMIDVVSHEFFHIVTPLSVHSADVHYFDYNEPTFSKHLWMYEGVTEYFATLFQVNQDLVDETAFYSKLIDKINMSLRMDDTMSFTKMSENVLNEPYASNYYNVYQKGALIGMCIDIIMREESNGQRGILSLMKELSMKYGQNKPFDDDTIIDEITTITYPAVGEFLKSHVVGTTPINYDTYFEKVGLIKGEGKIETNFLLNNGDLILGGDPINRTIFFSELVADNSFWHDQGVLPNDIIKSINGEEMTIVNANEILQKTISMQPGEDIEVVLDRNGEQVVVKTKLTKSYTTGKVLQPNPDATAKQTELRKAWLKG